MIDKSIEVPKDQNILYVNDLTEKKMNEIIQSSNNFFHKMIIQINNDKQLVVFNHSKIIYMKAIHLTLICSRQNFLELNIVKLIEHSIVKNIQIEDLKIKIELFTDDNISESTKQNNVKIFERIEFMDNYIKQDSKIHEALYYANKILNSYKKQVEKQEIINSKIKSLDNLIDRL